jgi:phosphonate transport system substrate-binding protein
MLESLPPDLKSTIKSAFLEAASKDKAAFDKLSDGKNQPWQTVDNASYDDTIKLIQFVDGLRKKAA